MSDQQLGVALGEVQEIRLDQLPAIFEPPNSGQWHRIRAADQLQRLAQVSLHFRMGIQVGVLPLRRPGIVDEDVDLPAAVLRGIHDVVGTTLVRTAILVRYGSEAHGALVGILRTAGFDRNTWTDNDIIYLKIRLL